MESGSEIPVCSLFILPGVPFVSNRGLVLLPTSNFFEVVNDLASFFSRADLFSSFYCCPSFYRFLLYIGTESCLMVYLLRIFYMMILSSKHFEMILINYYLFKYLPAVFSVCWVLVLHKYFMSIQ